MADSERTPTHAVHCPSCTCSSTVGTFPCATGENSSVASLEEMIALLQAEIADKNKLLVAYKRQRNARLPVARLPVEILFKVFYDYQDAEGLPTRRYIPTISWIAITHVSYHWRSVALSDPRLWTSLNLRFPNLVGHFSQYFGSIPLHIILSPMPEDEDEDEEEDRITFVSIERALRDVCHAQNPLNTVELCGTEYELSRLAPIILERAANEIVTIKLEHRSYDSDSYKIDGLEETSLPNLRVLSLEYVTILSLNCTMISSCATSLQELTLCCCMLEGPHDFDALSSMVKLEKLSMERCFDMRLVQNNTATISLPALTTLALHEAADDCILLLARFQPPSGCSTSVRLLPRLFTLGEFEPPAPEDLVRHIIATRPRGELCLRFGTHNLHILCERHALEIPLSHATVFGFTWDQLAGVVCAILDSGPDVLRLVWEQDFCHVNAAALIALCSDAGSVRTLKVEGVCVPLAALAKFLRAHETFLPTLAALQVEDADFTRLGASKKAWRAGVEARRATLKKITIVACMGVPPS